MEGEEKLQEEDGSDVYGLYFNGASKQTKVAYQLRCLQQIKNKESHITITKQIFWRNKDLAKYNTKVV